MMPDGKSGINKGYTPHLRDVVNILWEVGGYWLYQSFWKLSKEILANNLFLCFLSITVNEPEYMIVEGMEEKAIIVMTKK